MEKLLIDLCLPKIPEHLIFNIIFKFLPDQMTRSFLLFRKFRYEKENKRRLISFFQDPVKTIGKVRLNDGQLVRRGMVVYGHYGDNPSFIIGWNEHSSKLWIDGPCIITIYYSCDKLVYKHIYPAKWYKRVPLCPDICKRVITDNSFAMQLACDLEKTRNLCTCDDPHKQILLPVNTITRFACCRCTLNEKIILKIFGRRRRRQRRSRQIRR